MLPPSPRALPTAGDSCGRGSGHCRLLPTAAVPRTLPPSPFGDNRACPLQGRAEGQKFFPRDACPPAAPRSDGGRVRFFELAPPVPGPPTSRPAVRTAWAHGAVLDGRQTRPGVKPRLLKLLKTGLLQVFFFFNERKSHQASRPAENPALFPSGTFFPSHCIPGEAGPRLERPSHSSFNFHSVSRSVPVGGLFLPCAWTFRGPGGASGAQVRAPSHTHGRVLRKPR